MKKTFKTAIQIFSFLAVMTNLSFGQTIDKGFFDNVDTFLKKHVKANGVDYALAKSGEDLNKLINIASKADLSNLDDASIQAFYINAYNLNVIKQIVDNYPINSAQSISGFFDKTKITVANVSSTLNELEKEKLLKAYKDPRFHFVLVCGAKGCPPITNFAYTPSQLNEQLDKQTRMALNDDQFIRASSDGVGLSQIFNWYSSDFGKNRVEVIEFINKYRSSKLNATSKVKYYEYDWDLNDVKTGSAGIVPASTSSNQSRYIVSSTIPKGTAEVKIFNNLYSQQTGNGDELFNRSSFNTTLLSAMFGLTNRFNVGFATRYRKVRNNPLPSSPFSVFGSGAEGSTRTGLTAFGPQIRYAPVPKWSNFSVQSSFVFPIGEDLAGSPDQPYIDWNGATWWTQFFNDFSIGTQFSLFTEIDFLWEDIGDVAEGHINRISTPVTAIFSYIPTNKLTLYTLAGYSPYWQSEFDYFAQFGVGTKYQFTPNFEIELLYTDFSNKFLATSGGQAETINLGVRMNFR